MSDDRLRSLERAWRASGAPADEAAWLRERVRSGDDSVTRLYFPGNPWPKGHRLEQLRWKGRLTEAGAWFDLELRTTDYDADDPPGTDDGYVEGQRDWEARVAWNNFHACSISSNKGFLVGTDDDPLDLDRLAEREWRVDPLGDEQTAAELDHDDLGFHTYLLGHDTVADHRIRFALREEPDAWWLSWRGRVALTYVGEETFDHAFELPFALSRFEGLEVELDPEGSNEMAPRELLARFVARPETWHPVHVESMITAYLPVAPGPTGLRPTSSRP